MVLVFLGVRQVSGSNHQQRRILPGHIYRRLRRTRDFERTCCTWLQEYISYVGYEKLLHRRLVACSMAMQETRNQDLDGSALW
jgi:hypothetical protein